MDVSFDYLFPKVKLNLGRTVVMGAHRMPAAPARGTAWGAKSANRTVFERGYRRGRSIDLEADADANACARLQARPVAAPFSNVMVVNDREREPPSA